MMLLKLNQQLIQGLAYVLQQVADLKDATNCCWQRCISVIVYWLSLTVRVLLDMYWHFRSGRSLLLLLIIIFCFGLSRRFSRVRIVSLSAVVLAD